MKDAPRVAVVGAGAWGTTLGALLAGKGLPVRLWAREAEVVAAINTGHENPAFLPGIGLPPSLAATGDLAGAVAGADLVLLAVPSRWLRATTRALAACHPTPRAFLTVTKGLEIETGMRMSEVAAAELAGNAPVAALSGPNLAPEIAAGQPAATVIAHPDLPLASWLQEVLRATSFRTYTSPDIIGVEVCGAVKNVIAIGTGICEGLGLGDNARATLLTRALAEMGRLVARLGGDPATVAGLAGIGDLMATCASPMSRNHRVGLHVGRGGEHGSALGDSGQVAEGVPTTRAVVALARRLEVEMPICEEVWAILFDARPAGEAVTRLMGRPARSEL